MSSISSCNTDVALLSETHLKPHERFCIPKYCIYQTDCFPGRKGGAAVAVRKGVCHNYIDLPPLISVEATGVWKPIRNSELLLVALCKSPGSA
jgi:hypothetical protein